MKPYFYFYLVILTLFMVGCCETGNRTEMNANSECAPDTLWTPTGDAELDSLLQLAATNPQDTNLVRLYDEIGEMYRNIDAEKAKTYFLKTGELSEQLDWNTGRILFATDFSLMLSREMLIDSAIAILNPAYELAKREKREDWTANIAYYLAVAYESKSWVNTALPFYMEALSFYERQNKTSVLEVLYYMISQVYDDLNMYDKAIEYCEKSLALNPKNPSALFCLGRAYSYSTQSYEKGISYFEEALEISKEQNNIYLIPLIYGGLANNYICLLDLKKAEFCLHQTLEYNSNSDGSALYNYGRLEMLKGNYVQSETYLKEALQIVKENEDYLLQTKCLKLLFGLAVALHHYSDIDYYLTEGDLIEIKIETEISHRAVAEMEAKYETEKKELKISALEEEHRLMLWLGIAGGAVLLLALAAAIFFWRLTAQRKRLVEQEKQLMEQQIKQLEQEQQLVATQSVLDGETRERTRLAKDLHDGLGSMLTGVKLNLQEVKGGVKLETTEVETFNKAMKLLDESVQEMRRISHHLMPDSLSRFGLKSAVTDFCNSLSANITFNYYGDETRLDPKMEVMIYRTIHELVNNALKHAGAENIMVQIMQEPDRIAFTVEDNGCGFDTQSPTKGMGLQNIRTRITAYNGRLLMDSKIGEGTEINVELKIENDKSSNS